MKNNKKRTAKITGKVYNSVAEIIAECNTEVQTEYARLRDDVRVEITRQRDAEPTPEKIEIGERHRGDTLSGYRVIGNDTSSGRPWMWYAPTVEAARLLANAICSETGEDVTVCKFLGVVQRVQPASEFIPTDDV